MKINDYFSGVPHETKDKIIQYIALLAKWNKKRNLIRYNNEEELIRRHIIDCMQIAKYFSRNDRVIDLGSGAGLPGVIISIITNSDVTVVDSDQNKCIFLNEVQRELGLNYNVVNSRIENIADECYDILTSRALASLNILLDYSIRFMHDKSILIFLKGEKYLEEINDAKKHWKFDIEIIDSETNNNSKILIIKNLAVK